MASRKESVFFEGVGPGWSAMIQVDGLTPRKYKSITNWSQWVIEQQQQKRHEVWEVGKVEVDLGEVNQGRL